MVVGGNVIVNFIPDTLLYLVDTRFLNCLVICVLENGHTLAVN